MDASTADKTALPQGEALYGKPPPDAGEWLFKDKDQVLGPVPPEMLLTKLYDGYLTADTPVAQEVGQWKPLKEIWFLGPHVARAQQKMAYQLAVEERARIVSSLLKTRLLLALVTFAVVFTALLAGARWLMISRPWEDKTDWLTRRPALVRLPDRTPKVAAVVEKKEEKPAEQAAAPAEEKKAPPAEDKKKDDRATKDTRKDPAKDKGKKDDKSAKKDDKPAEKKPADEVKTEAPRVAGLPVELSKEEMLGVFKSGAGGYMQCIREEAQRNPNMPSVITVEFVIKGNGSTTDFKVQEREVRTGPLATCLGQKIGALKFPRFSGENKFFQFPFKITRK